MLNPKVLGLAVAGGALAVLVGVAVVRESRVPVPPVAAPTPAAGMGESHDRPPMSAEEERFAHDLWKVHSDIRTQAVRMSFTGIAYKTGEIPKEAVRDRIGPLVKVFGQAATDIRAIATPTSMQPVRNRYLEAVELYGKASGEMVKVAQDGKDTHLIVAQEMSQKASTLLLEVSEKLWPGEFKPN
ncbi:MAG: hypothetical protein U1F52_19770 [Burkholderiales bacterium]